MIKKMKDFLTHMLLHFSETPFDARTQLGIVILYVLFTVAFLAIFGQRFGKMPKSNPSKSTSKSTQDPFSFNIFKVFLLYFSYC